MIRGFFFYYGGKATERRRSGGINAKIGCLDGSERKGRRRKKGGGELRGETGFLWLFSTVIWQF